MPTVPRRPAAQRERDRLHARRLRAAELFAAVVRQAEVARQLGVSARRHGCRTQLAQIEQALLKAPRPTDSPASYGRWSASPS
jgi:hypothetical protein